MSAFLLLTACSSAVSYADKNTDAALQKLGISHKMSNWQQGRAFHISKRIYSIPFILSRHAKDIREYPPLLILDEPDPKNPSEKIGVIQLFPDLVTERIQLKQGDELVRINDYDAKDKKQSLMEIVNKETSLNKPIFFTILRDSAELKIKMPTFKASSAYKAEILAGSPGLYAFAKGRENFYISWDLMSRFQDDNQIAFIMAHGIAHLELGHTQINLKSIVARSLVKSLTTSLLKSATRAPVASAGGYLSGEVVGKAFSRSDEKAADLLAVQMMAEAGYDPHAAPVALHNLVLARGSRFIQVPFFETHPLSDDRIAYLTEEANKYSKR